MVQNPGQAQDNISKYSSFLFKNHPLWQLFESSPIAALIANEEGEILEVNPRFRQIFDWTPAEALGLETWWRLACPDRPEVAPVEATIACKDGQSRVFKIRDSALGETRCVFFVGAQELGNGEQSHQVQSHQVQRMEALGHLAGGIAHDFNNLLMAIMGHVDLALGETEPDHPALESLKIISQTTNRAAKLVSKLMTFSRKRLEAPMPVDLNRSIGDLRELVRSLIPENVAISTDLGDDLGSILADPTEIEQVLLNLVVNAGDAMPNGGRLTIATSRAIQGDAHSGEDHPFIRLRIGDTGEGISPELHGKIFDPFFTTKSEGRGTGLGLATTYRIVQELAGKICFVSEAGVGTTFDVFLPETSAPTQVAVSVTSPRPTTPRHGTILLVEDDEVLRMVIAELLRSSGYSVVDAQTGEEALEEALHPGARALDLLLTDAVLPGIDGSELAERLHPHFPELRIILTSGHPPNNHRSQREMRPGARFLQKPVTPEALLGCVRDLLAQPRGG